MHQNVARCRDGDVSLKYDAAECSPGLLSMEWYPSIIVPGCHRMFTSVGEHGMVPLLVPGVFPPVVFPCRQTACQNTCRELQLFCFADDTTLYVSGHSIADSSFKLSSTLSAANKWLSDSGLQLNASKTKNMLIQSSCLKSLPPLDIQLDGSSIDQVQTYKYLGVHGT